MEMEMNTSAAVVARDSRRFDLEKFTRSNRERRRSRNCAHDPPSGCAKCVLLIQRCAAFTWATSTNLATSLRGRSHSLRYFLSWGRRGGTDVQVLHNAHLPGF